MASLRELLFPTAEISVVSELSPDQVQARLSAAAADQGRGWYFKRRRAGQRFVRLAQEPLTLERLVPYPDPWRPVLTMRLEPKGSGTVVHMSLHLSRLGRVVTTLWHGLALLVGGVVALGVITGVLLPRGLIVTGMALIYMAVPLLDQRVEARATRGLLTDMLK